jgi:hypothetical protein
MTAKCEDRGVTIPRKGNNGVDYSISGMFAASAFGQDAVSCVHGSRDRLISR